MSIHTLVAASLFLSVFVMALFTDPSLGAFADPGSKPAP
jgi:Na+/melibiose symporter-like transporter